jgi:DNA-binding MarR family transcriptional regulator
MAGARCPQLWDRVMTPLSLVEKLKLAEWLVKELTGDQFKVAFALLFRFHNSKTGNLFPSYTQQAEAARVSKSTATRTVKILEGLGALDVERTDGGRNRRNSYTLKMVSPAAPLEGNGVTSGPLRVSPAYPPSVTSGPAYINECKQGKDQGRDGRAATATPKSELEKVLDIEHAKAIIEHRQKLKKPLNAYAAKLLANQLAQHPDPNAAADHMIMRGWLAFDPTWAEAAKSVRGRARQPDEVLDAFGAPYEEVR